MKEMMDISILVNGIGGLILFAVCLTGIIAIGAYMLLGVIRLFNNTNLEHERMD